jgi:TnpA family transposase
LIVNDDGIFSLNDVRYDQKDFAYTAIIEEVKKVQELSSIYEFCKVEMPKLELSQNAIRYYSSNIEQYPISRLRKLLKSQQYLYTICYIYHRYQMFMDNLISSFMHHSVKLEDVAKDFADAEFASHVGKIVKKYPKLTEFFRWFPGYEYKKIQQEEFYKEAYEIVEKEDFEIFAKFFERSDFDIKAVKWEFIENSSRSTALYLRPIILSVNFEHYSPDNTIMPLVEIIRNHYSTGKSPVKLQILGDEALNIPASILKYLKSNAQDSYLNPYRFEYYVYQKIYHHLYRGRVFCNDSVSYRDIEADLIPESMVEKAIEAVKRYGYTKIPIYCSEHLDQKLSELNKSWQNLYKNIDNNKGINIINMPDGSLEWQLNYNTCEKLDDVFFKNIPKLDVADIFVFIDSIMHIFEGFTHIKGRYIKRLKPVVINVIACILSEAFGFGIKKMSEMCDLKFSVLRSTKEDFIRYETLCKVNEIIANKINTMPIFKAWNLLDDKLLADIDGQKASTGTNTIQSRYSKKYLGKGKGLSILSMIANFVPVAVKNIGLNEYEGHHLYDMIYDNQSDIKIDAITGDNHALNQLNFLALGAINVEFIPSIKNIKSAADDLYSYEEIDCYQGLIKPIAQINVDRIKNEEKQIVRVLLSLVLQENTQSTIIRKLNSQSRYASLRAGLIEYNKILKSTHVLNLINNMPLRKAIITARNRTEAYHQLQNLIRKMHYGVYNGRRIVNHKISTQAVRLVTNTAVAYNATILNMLYIKLIELGYSEKDIERFLRISPMAWIHIAFTGRYTFNNKNNKIDLNEIIITLEKELKSLGIKNL